MAERIPVTLACTECNARNYKTTRKPARATTDKRAIELKKFCPTCKKHTVHKETK